MLCATFGGGGRDGNDLGVEGGVAGLGLNRNVRIVMIAYMYLLDRVGSMCFSVYPCISVSILIQAVKEEYKEKDAQFDLDRTFFFESDNITIDIPLKGINIEGGWKIMPLTNPVVS